jgi:hypothetical protein
VFGDGHDAGERVQGGGDDFIGEDAAAGGGGEGAVEPVAPQEDEAVMLPLGEVHVEVAHVVVLGRNVGGGGVGEAALERDERFLVRPEAGEIHDGLRRKGRSHARARD